VVEKVGDRIKELVADEGWSEIPRIGSSFLSEVRYKEIAK